MVFSKEILYLKFFVMKLTLNKVWILKKKMEHMFRKLGKSWWKKSLVIGNFKNLNCRVKSWKNPKILRIKLTKFGKFTNSFSAIFILKKI